MKIYIFQDLLGSGTFTLRLRRISESCIYEIYGAVLYIHNRVFRISDFAFLIENLHDSLT